MYEWVKAFHVISMVAWFAALFYLPRLFVYHSMSEDEISVERFKTMQHKLYWLIANPSMFATIALGIWLVSLAPDYYLNQNWFRYKIAAVLLLVAYHHACLFYLKRFASDSNIKSHKFFRIFNEIPVLFLIVITILVVVKPF